MSVDLFTEVLTTEEQMMKSNTCRLLLALSLFGLAIGQGLYSQAIDENALFANTNAQLIDKSKITDSSLDPGITKKGVTMTASCEVGRAIA
jgi:hypothetical protein